MCKVCKTDTRRSGLREVDGLCISCWRDRAAAADELLGEIARLKARYGDNLKISILRVIEAADRIRGREAGVSRTTRHAAGIQR